MIKLVPIIFDGEKKQNIKFNEGGIETSVNLNSYFVLVDTLDTTGAILLNPDFVYNTEDNLPRALSLNESNPYGILITIPYTREEEDIIPLTKIIEISAKDKFTITRNETEIFKLYQDTLALNEKNKEILTSFKELFKSISDGIQETLPVANGSPDGNWAPLKTTIISALANFDTSISGYEEDNTALNESLTKFIDGE